MSVTNILPVSIGTTHTGDNQSPGAVAQSLSTAGPTQITNVLGNLDRLREAGVDGIAAIGLQAGAANFAMAFATTDATDNFAAGTRTFTPAAMSGTIQNVAWSIQVGSVLTLDTGANAENVVVTATTATTFTCVTAKAHNGTVTAFPVVGFVYNQERDFVGEGANPTGQGAAIATEFESNSGGPPLASGLPSGLTLDADRNYQGKATAQLAVTATGAGNTTIQFSGNPWTSGLTINSPMYLSVGANGAAVEEVKVSANNVPATGAGPITVNLVNPIVNANSTFATFDIFGLIGPAAGYATVLGIEDNLEYVFDPNAADPKRPIAPIIAATGDAAAGKNIPMENGALWNGATFNREMAATASPTNGAGSALVSTGLAPLQSFLNQSANGTNGTALDNGVARPQHSLFVVSGAGVSAGVVTLQGSNDNANWFNTATTVTTNAANATFAAGLANFPFRYVRASITTVITGGTVTATIASAG